MGLGELFEQNRLQFHGSLQPLASVRNELSLNVLIISNLQHMMRRINHFAAQLVHAKPIWPIMA
jgi:hypothetical protein